MPRVLTIVDDGTEYHPADYAAMWGDDSSTVGRMCYNCGESAGPGRVVANTEWDAGEWADFARHLSDLRAEVANAVRISAGAEGSWTAEDVANLDRLAEWADANATQGLQTYSNEVVRLSEAVAFGCSGSGSQDANVASALGGDAPGVEWLADADAIRDDLGEYGAWDADELADDAANRERALWLAAGAFSDDPEMYAD